MSIELSGIKVDIIIIIIKSYSATYTGYSLNFSFPFTPLFARVMELFVSGGRIARLMEKVLYNTFNSNFMTIEVERRRAIKSVKEERHGDRSRAQPTEYAELINRGGQS